MSGTRAPKAQAMMGGGGLREQSSDSHQERRPRRLAAAVRRTTRRQQCASVSHLDEMDDKKAAWVRAVRACATRGKMGSSLARPPQR